MNILEDIEREIKKHLPGSQVYILDPRNDGVHLEAIVISEEFCGLNLVKQHQKVMLPLSNHFKTTLHALALKTFTPEAWENHKEKIEA